jgi:hypothetical protein
MIRLLSAGALAAAGLVAVGIGSPSANVMRSPSHGSNQASFAIDGNTGSLFELLQTRFAAAVGSADLRNGKLIPNPNEPRA